MFEVIKKIVLYNNILCTLFPEHNLTTSECEISEILIVVIYQV